MWNPNQKPESDYRKSVLEVADFVRHLENRKRNYVDHATVLLPIERDRLIRMLKRVLKGAR